MSLSCPVPLLSHLNFGYVICRQSSEGSGGGVTPPDPELCAQHQHARGGPWLPRVLLPLLLLLLLPRLLVAVLITVLGVPD